MVKVIESTEEFKALIESGNKVIVDFYADWCGPCKVIAPKFEKFSTETEDVTFVKVNVDNLEEVSQTAGIRAMPTFQTYHKGAKVGELLGADLNKLKALIADVQAIAA
ncbi:hypothetical protein BGZ83_001277 [Gryganskiella cystojenkinii]|nr:hypothetical protein BGZ83_001277 [Gryganskiella cystojenkinii]